MPPVRPLASSTGHSPTGGIAQSYFYGDLPAGHSPASHRAAKPGLKGQVTLCPQSGGEAGA